MQFAELIDDVLGVLMSHGCCIDVVWMLYRCGMDNDYGIDGVCINY